MITTFGHAGLAFRVTRSTFAHAIVGRIPIREYCSGKDVHDELRAINAEQCKTTQATESANGRKYAKQRAAKKH
jgi:hypothetical protein